MKSTAHILKLNRMDDKIFKKDAKDLVDMVFNAKFFKEHITRDDMNAIEELIDYLLKSKFESYLRIDKLMKDINKISKS